MGKELWFLEEVRRLLIEDNDLSKSVSMANKKSINQAEIDRRAYEIGVYLFNQINQSSKSLVLRKK